MVRLFLAGCRAQKVRRGSPAAIWRAGAQAYENFRRFAPASLAHLAQAKVEPYAAWQQANRLTPRLRAILEASARNLQPAGPRFVLLLDARGCTAAQLQACADSLRAQIYPQWEAWFVGEGSAPAGDAVATSGRSLSPQVSPSSPPSRAPSSGSASSEASRTRPTEFHTPSRGRSSRPGGPGSSP